jgi:Cof subfamily protein (haloacid dehalogenase superfamily)
LNNSEPLKPTTHRAFRIVALDIDGTLLTDTHRLTDATKKAVREAHARGAVIVLCTGRGPYNAVPILEQLELEGTLITHNGAVTIRHPGNELLHQFEFESHAIHPLIEYARQKHIHFDLCTAFEMFLDRCGSEAEAMYRQFMIEPTRVEDSKLLVHPIVKLTFFGRPEQMDRVEEDWSTLHVPLTMIRSGRRFIDIMSPKASKGEALRVLAEGWNVDRSEVLAIGNYYNDSEMLEYAGVGIAMDNSPEALKQLADEVTLSNNEDGVAAALRKYGLAD